MVGYDPSVAHRSVVTGVRRYGDSSTVLLVGTDDWLTEFTATLETRTDASVQHVRTKAEAIDIVRRRRTDCLISEYSLEETTGLDLFREIRGETTTLPVLLATTAGSEAIASEAVEASVTDYIALTDPPAQMTNELIERTERAIRSAQRSATQRERADSSTRSSTIRELRRGCSIRMAHSPVSMRQPERWSMTTSN